MYADQRTARMLVAKIMEHQSVLLYAAKDATGRLQHRNKTLPLPQETPQTTIILFQGYDQGPCVVPAQ